MDTATHALAGACIAGSLPCAIRGRDATIVVVGAALLPDIDVLWSLSNPATATLTRHVLTHSLFGAALLSAGFGALVWRLTNRLSLLAAILLATLGVLSHLGLDLINAYGVALLYPWSTARFELPLAFIVDPSMMGLLAVGLVLPRIAPNKASAPLMSRAALVMVCCYLAICFGLRISAEHLLAARAAIAGSGRWYYLAPELGSPLRWKGIVREGEGYRQVIIHPLTDDLVDLDFVNSAANERSIVAARATEIGRQVEAFFKAPVWRAEGDAVYAYDLRFRFVSLDNDWDPFGFCFRRAGEAFILAPQKLDTYLANWGHALIKFGITRSAQAMAAPCAEAGSTSEQRH